VKVFKKSSCKGVRIVVVFKCKECGKLQYSSCLNKEPCIYCGGEIEVEDVEKLKEASNESI